LCWSGSVLVGSLVVLLGFEETFVFLYLCFRGGFLFQGSLSLTGASHRSDRCSTDNRLCKFPRCVGSVCFGWLSGLWLCKFPLCVGSVCFGWLSGLLLGSVALQWLHDFGRLG
jgi:hypothetical protein